LVPTAEEQALVKNFDGAKEDLADAEQFFFSLCEIVNIRRRLELWQFKIEFETLCKDQEDKITILKGAVDLIRESKSFKFIMQYILIVGNYMNGAKKTNVIGFKLETLTTLEQIKSEDQTQSLLSFIVEQLKIKHPIGLEFAGQFLSKLPPAIKLDTEQLKKDVNSIGKTLSEIKEMMENIKEEENNKKENEHEHDHENEKEQEINANSDLNDTLNTNNIVIKHIQKKKIEKDIEKDLFPQTMRQFHNQAKSKYNKLLEYLENTIGKSLQLGEYLGEPEPESGTEYMKTLITFSTSVLQIVENINKQKEIELKKQRHDEIKRQEEARPKPQKKITSQFGDRIKGKFFIEKSQ